MYSRSYDNRMGLLSGELHSIQKLQDGSWRTPFPEPTYHWQRRINALMREPEFPSMRLWAAVLAQAVLEVTGDSPEPHRPASADYPGAREWIFASDPRCTVGSFDWVCEALDLDAETVRRDILKGLSDATA